MEDSLKLHLYDKTKVVVVDLGYKYTKVGFGGEPNPRFITPTVIPQTCKSVLDVDNVKDLYDNLVEFIHFLYFRRLLVNPKETKVVIVESLLSPTSVRKTMAKVLFSHLNVSAALFVPSHMVALYSLAVPTSLSIDLGFTETCIVPVYHGYPVLHAYQVTAIGSKAIEAEIRNLLYKYYSEHDPSKVPTITQLSNKTIEEIKVSLCFVAPLNKVSCAEEETTRPPDVPFPLPGAPPIVIPGSVRVDACEILFRPDIDGVCLPTMVLDAILKCPLDMRKPLAESLFLFGGTAMLRGLRTRLAAEINLLLTTPQYKDKLHIDDLKMYSPPCKDNYTAWLGDFSGAFQPRHLLPLLLTCAFGLGSLLGATETVVARAVTREEFNQEGDIPDWANLKYNVKKGEACRKPFSTRIL